MEKIQSAIAKARAERGQQDGVPVRAGGAGRGTLGFGGAPAPRAAVGTPDAAGDTASAAGPTAASAAGPNAASAAGGPNAAADRLWQALPDGRFSAALLERNRIVSVASAPEAVPFDVLRTRFLNQMRSNGWRRVAITSPGASCGKSTVSVNLAFSLARQADLRVILAEVDLRKPSIARMLGIPEDHHFGRVLQGDLPFAQNALRSGANLAIATNRTATRAAAEILQSRSAVEALNEIEAAYDPSVMIFDMPPMLIGDDVAAFAACVDCVLLVGAAETSTIEEIDSCERELAGLTNVLGVVVNKCRYLERTYGYYG